MRQRKRVATKVRQRVRVVVDEGLRQSYRREQRLQKVKMALFWVVVGLVFVAGVWIVLSTVNQPPGVRRH